MNSLARERVKENSLFFKKGEGFVRTMLRRTFGSAAAQVKPRFTNLLIDGKFVPATGNKTFDTFNPATEASLVVL
jgi:hypothetical protein